MAKEKKLKKADDAPEMIRKAELLLDLEMYRMIKELNLLKKTPPKEKR